MDCSPLIKLEQDSPLIKKETFLIAKKLYKEILQEDRKYNEIIVAFSCDTLSSKYKSLIFSYSTDSLLKF
ncbi:hypothetical protein BH11BAC3_BH11BAC3_38460 [soil metagenome]